MLVKNTSGADQPRFAVLGVDAPLVLPGDHLDQFKNRVALRGVTPAVAHRGRFVVLMEPLRTSAIGRACALGVCCVKLNVPEHGQGLKFADIVDGDAAAITASIAGLDACIDHVITIG